MSTTLIVVLITIGYVAVGLIVWCLLTTAKTSDRTDGSDA